TTAPFLERHFELRTADPSAAASEPSFVIVRPDPTGLGAWRRLTRFVGRQTEMELLRSRWDQSANGRGQAVALVGDPGVGKARLRLEFMRTLDQISARMLRIPTSASEDPSRSRPAATLVRTLFAIEPGASRDSIRETLEAQLRALELSPELLPP